MKPPPTPRKKKSLNELAFIEPELATLTDEVPDSKDWVHEIKFDGYRTLALIENNAVRMMTRTGLDWTGKFQALADRLATVGRTVMLDGEIVALNDQGKSSFKVLQDTLKNGGSQDLQYYVFDLVHLDGQDLRSLPLLERKTRLKALLDGHDFEGRVNYSDHFGPDSGFIGKVCGLGLEGIVSKRANASYRSGRNASWLKIKCHKRQEFVIGGFREPTHAARGIGALMLGYYEDEKFVYAGKVGTGFDGETLRALRKRLDKLVRKTMAYDKVPPEIRREAIWVEPEIVCEIEFTEWTPDGRLRHPSFQGLREDKPAKAVGRDHEIHTGTAEKEAKMEVRNKPKAPAKAKKDGKIDVGGIGISHPDRVIYPGSDITKFDLAHYYLKVADAILPFVANRPLSMVRCPEGIGEECFFQRHMPHDAPHILSTGIQVKDRDEDYIMIREEKGLISLVQWGCIELHPWGCLADQPDKPDRMIFDLDPDPEVPWSAVVEGAAEVRDRMRELGLQAFLKTTGGKGLHVVVPMQRQYGWPTIKAFARAIAESMAHDAPERYIATMSKEKRKGRIFVDYLRNDLTSTAVSAWSARARPGATVSTLLDWSELGVDLKPAAFTIKTVPERLARQTRDPWADFHTHKQVIRKAYLDALKIETG
ncbi:MAG: DNA ligase D [Asticcacaulis sp.]